MSRISELFRKGDELFDRSDFEGAVKVYEEALFLEEESVSDANMKDGMLHNIHQARRLAHLALLQRLLAKFPDSVYFQIDCIKWHLADHNPQVALNLCEKLFTQLEQQGSPAQPYQLRMNVIRRNGLSTRYVEDFLNLWKQFKNPKGKGIKLFLQDILSTSDVRLLPAFIELSQHPEFSPNIQTLFKQKAESLQLLQQVYETELA